MIKLFAPSLLIIALVSCTTLGSNQDQITSGGRLYDIWWVDTQLAKPEDTHPSYPSEGHKRHASTWRCKECHGWDYKGKEGRYGKGGHFTGIKGIKGKSGADVNSIVTILKDSNHQYQNRLSESQLNALALFVSQGQINVDDYIDQKSRKAKGEAANGKAIYQDNCQRCHGEKGTFMGLQNQNGIKAYIADVANQNPWEVLHKIRFGQPGAKMGMAHMPTASNHDHEAHQDKFKMGEAMPPMFGKLTKQQEMDLLAYMQTLSKYSEVRFF